MFVKSKTSGPRSGVGARKAGSDVSPTRCSRVRTLVGIDSQMFSVGPSFKGIKMIPPGVHFIFYSSSSRLFSHLGIMQWKSLVSLLFGCTEATRKLEELLQNSLGWESQQSSAVDGIYFEENDECAPVVELLDK